MHLKSFNNHLNNYFEKKPSFNKLLYTLRKEESLSYNDYERKIGRIWEKKIIKFRKTNKINNIIRDYKNEESQLIYRNEIIDLWYDCLTKLNNLTTNL